MTNLWIRFEPRCRGESLRPGLEARLIDPLWILARQWMMGEFDGEDAGTPVGASATLSIAPMITLSAGGETLSLRGEALPLDAATEGLAVRTPAANLRERIELWRALVSSLGTLLDDTLHAALLEAFQLPAPNAQARLDDPEGSALYDFASGRLGDGLAVLDACRDGSRPATLTAANLADAVTDWLEFAAASRPVGAGATWSAERLGYDFDVACADFAAVARVAGHNGDGLHWADFDLTAVPPTETAQKIKLQRPPTAIRFGGMPSVRYWEFEDSVLDLGSIDAPSAELARAALVQFAMLYGADAFSIPVQLPLGVFAKIDELKVADTFADVLGETTIPSALRVGAGVGQGWAFWAAEAQGAPQPWVCFPRAAMAPLRGERLEEVVVLRDEMANLVWKVDVARLAGDGRARAPAATEGVDAPPPSNAALEYRLSSAVPDGWSAFELEVDTGGVRRLRLGAEGPAGQVIGPNAVIHDEEVGREGLRLVLEDVYARGGGGGTFVWRRIRRGVGRGGGSSGLRFDFTQPKPDSA